VADKLSVQPGYFQKNAGRMRYPEFRRQGLFVGSGVIEVGRVEEPTGHWDFRWRPAKSTTKPLSGRRH
jgi:hypothetical protein